MHGHAGIGFRAHYRDWRSGLFSGARPQPLGADFPHFSDGFGRGGEGRIKTTFNRHLFTSADASEPEDAGILGTLLGTFWTMLVTFVLSFPVSVMAALGIGASNKEKQLICTVRGAGYAMGKK